MMSEQASLPYGGDSDPNSGFSGSDTSEARARTDDRTGLTGRRQRAVLAQVTEAGNHGMTWRELASAMDLHHGQASAALSNLHKAGRIARLRQTRGRCKVYVANQHIDDRAIEAAGANSTTEMLAEMADLLARSRRMCPHTVFSMQGCLSCETDDLLRRYEARR